MMHRNGFRAGAVMRGAAAAAAFGLIVGEPRAIERKAAGPVIRSAWIVPYPAGGSTDVLFRISPNS